MSNNEYKRCIVAMLEQIDNNEFLKRIFDYVHKYFIKRTGE